MQVLLTGGAGFVGSHTAKALAEAGHVPVVVDNLRTGHRHAVRWGPFEHGDVRDTPFVLDVVRRHRIEAVIHFAALSSVADAANDPEGYHDVNVGGTIALVRAMRATGIDRLVFSSTAATYDPAGRSGVGNPLCEEDPQHPANPYGQSKLAAERLLSDCCAAWGLGTVALRYFNAAGADPDGDLGEEHDPETHLIPVALKVAAGLEDALTVFGTDHPTPDGTCVRDYVHVSDLARAHVAALGMAPLGKFRAYNLGSGLGTSVLEVIGAVEEVTGRHLPWRAAARRAGDPAVLVAKADRAASELGFAPRHDLRGMIETAWRFMARRSAAAPSIRVAGPSTRRPPSDARRARSA